MAVSAAKLIKVGGAETLPPLIFLHGFGADHLSWTFIASQFTSTHQVWAVDLPGHGGAGNEVGRGTLAELRESVGEALRPILAPGAALVGHSLGGALAIDLAGRFRHLVDRMVLIAPGGLVPLRDSEFITRFPQIRTAQEAIDHLRRLVVKQHLISEPMAQYLLASLDRDGRRAALQTIGANLLSAQRFPEPLPAHPMLIWGGEDQVFPAPAADRLRTPVSLLPGVGHLPMAEAPRDVAALIKDHLR